MKKNPEFDANDKFDNLVDWLTGERYTYVEGEIGKLGDMAGGEMCWRQACLFPSTIDRIAGWWAGAFLYAVFTNDKSDMATHGSRMLDYWFLGNRINGALDDTPGRPWIPESQKEFYPFYLLLLSFRRWDQAAWFGNRLYLGKDHGDPNSPEQPWSNTRPLGGFMLHLYQIVSGMSHPGDPFPASLPDPGPYTGIFTHWNDPDALPNFIAEACDYHVYRTTEDSTIEYDIADFNFLPYHVLPVEILALRAVRERLGLETPFPSHPLLDSPFVKNLPKELPPCGDGLLRDIIAATEKVLPGFLTDDPLHLKPGVVDIPPPPPPPPPQVFPVGLRREVEKSGGVFGRKNSIVIHYHIPTPEDASRCGEEIFAQLVKDYGGRKRISEVDIYVTGSADDMCTAYNAFQCAAKQHPEVNKWLLESVPRFAMNFDTPEGDIVRAFQYLTQDGRRTSSEMKPKDE